MFNSTPRLNQGGRMYITHLTQRIALPAAPSVMTGTQWDAMSDTLRALPSNYTTMGTWQDFAAGGRYEGKEFYVRVVDIPKYNDFTTHLGTISTIDNFMDNIALWSSSTEAPHPMSIMCIHWDSPDVGQEVRLQDLTAYVDAQIMTRWPVNTVPAQAAVDVQPATTTVAALADKGAVVNGVPGKR